MKKLPLKKSKMWRVTALVLFLLASVTGNLAPEVMKSVQNSTPQLARLVPRSPMLPQDGNMDLAMQSRAVDTRVQLGVKEGEPIKTLVGTIPIKSDFTYRFNESPQEFTLDPETGQIRTAKVLDREALPSDKFDLVILSSQPTYPIEVRIHVIDINDNNPEFPESSIAVSFSESAAAGTKLLLDAATDKDTIDNGVANDYFIVDGNTDNKFRLEVTGNPSGDSSYLHLETTGKLDREQVEFYSLNVCARDRGRPPRLGYLLVNVTILDVNDNPPIFQQSDYVVALNESVPVGTTVLTVHAFDNDIDDNSKVIYYLPERERKFTIDPDTGTIKTAEALNCEQRNCVIPRPNGSCPKSCVISVFARDHGSPRQNGRTYVTVNLIDANDHDPEIKFSYFPATANFATVDENAVKDSIVAAVAVIDIDEGLNGETSVKIQSGNELGNFRLEKTQTFDIVKVSGRLDREEIPKYNLTFIAVDKGIPPRSATAYLVINVNDVNDHDPVFYQSEYSAVLSEFSPIGSFVVSISATDADTGLNAKIYYDIDSGNEQSWFTIDQDTGLVTTTAMLNREIQGSIELKVDARDGGPNPRYASTHLRVTVLDENDEAPKFLQSVVNVSMSENMPPYSLVATMGAVDNDQGTNGSIAYSLHPSVLHHYSQTFSLDTLTGQLTTMVFLDREKQSDYHILVIARDQGAPSQSSTATVLLSIEDANDNAPIFYPKNYLITIPEMITAGTTIGQVIATDVDSIENARIKYSIESGGEDLFTLDEKSGKIIMLKSLPDVQKNIFELTISARDNGNKIAKDNAKVEIMRLKDSKTLKFDTSNAYTFNIFEDRGECTDGLKQFARDIGIVQLTHLSSSEVRFSIDDGDPQGSFKIDERSGLISTVGCLDREEFSYYSLKITARDGFFRGSILVNITVLDVNDNAPKFRKGEKSDDIFLKENAAIGQQVCLTRAKDSDAGINARITYILTQNPDELFRVSENSGIIYLAKSIRLPPCTVLSLEITATDSGSPPLSAQHQIKIIIEDVNDHTPIFQSMGYETSLPESTLVNERFFSLKAFDEDFGVNGKILYSITNGNQENRFGIFPDGQLYVKYILDREKQDYYALEVTASDQGTPSRSSTVPVFVYIIDENDNAPEFTNSSFTFCISENEPSNTFVGKLLATDKDVDRNADLTFSLPILQNDFTIDPRNGFITSIRMFDREKLIASTGSDYIIFEATVTDNGITPLKAQVKIIIYITDVNDNAPQFQRLPYHVQVSEASNIGTKIFRVYTMDVDDGLNGDVYYSIESGNEEDRFSIDKATGQISLAKSLDREILDSYELTVVAHDAGSTPQLSSSTTIYIDVLDENDNAPVFIDNRMKISVNETTLINTELLKFRATDNDLGSNSEVTFGISAGNRRDVFYIDPENGALYLKKPLDYEDLKNYTLNISCIDSGHPKLSSMTTLIVNVIDANDNPPVFPNTAIVRQIREGISVRTPVHSVSADDPDSGDNGAVTYTIASQDPDNQRRHFGINPLTGVIHTLLPIDREEIDTFKLVVVATDKAHPPAARLSAEKLVIVIVEDLNDNAPIFVSMSALILPKIDYLMHNLNKEISIGRLLARDLDSGTNGLVTYELMRSTVNDSDMFRIHRNTGSITMKIPKNLRTLEKVIFQIGVRATDEAVQTERRSSEAYLTLIVPGEDDYRPVWQHQGSLEGSIHENEPIGISILRVQARARRSDLDIEYYVVNITGGQKGEQADRLFDVDKKSGLLQTSRSLDRETGIEWYEVEIYAIAVGGERPSTTTVKVRITVLDKNDVAPSWGLSSWKYNISEELPLGTIITTLNAYDPDTIGTLRYSLVLPSIYAIPSTEEPVDLSHFFPVDEMDRPFTLDAVTGQLRLIQALDREKRQQYVLGVRADDGIQHSDVNITIQVTDTNDNAPVFQSVVYSFDILENEVRGTRVGEVRATDADAEGSNSVINYALISDWANDVFSLHPSTGVFTLTSSLDYEQVQHYVLVVQAADAGSPALSTTVTVYFNVVDLNDNAPIFELGPYSAEVFENTTINTSILSMTARDLDSGDNSKLSYSITSGDVNDDLAIESNGTLIIRKSLDRESKPIYNLFITAKDNAKSPYKQLSSSVQVTVVLLDVNDCFPKFVTPNITSVIENSPINTLIIAIKAVDEDEGKNGYVEYSLDDNSVPFCLGSIDGLLRVCGPLDRERQQNYTLKLIAKDRGEPSKSASSILTIIILDENDNAPIFSPRQYLATIAENATIGANVLQIIATDKDEEINGRLRYSIILGDENQDFTISEDGGVIRVAKNLNFERKSSYILIVKAEDGTENGEGSKYDNAEISINILDINDNAPIFLDSPYLIYVMENLMPPRGGFITQVRAYDADSPPYNNQVRYFLKEGDTDLFKINSSTGDIILLRSLDKEIISEYTLVLAAMDTGSPPLAGSGILKVMVLDVNDHSPEFARPEYVAVVSENLPAGAWVAKPTAVDRDEGINAKIRYSLLDEQKQYFSVNPDTGEVKTLISLDREKASIYHLTLVAQDSSVTEPKASAVNLTILIKDLNDNAPHFSSQRYTAYIPDSTKSGDFVFGAKAIDDDDGENSRIIYHLQGQDATKFEIDPSNGVIRAKEDLLISKNNYQLQIIASDCGVEPQADTADLIIYLWDHQLFPIFRSSINTRFILPEDVSEGRIIAKLNAVTPKIGLSSNLTFGIAGGNIGGALRIESYSGEVLVASVFDYETQPIYETWIEVGDSDNPSLRSVIQLLINITDANDNPPVFETQIYNSTVLEEEYPPVYVTKVQANDRDSGENGRITYYLLNSFDGSFIIDEHSGEISTNTKLDREEIDSYELVIEATDQGEPRMSGTATVLVSVLDKNDNPPRFTRLFSVNVTENAEIESFVIKITSSDQDIEQNANVTYMFGENPGNKFSINSVTGIVNVLGYLDREEQDEYLLKVRAGDGAWSQETTLTITILDQNDNAPQFLEDSYYFHFPETQNKITHIGQVSASDKDKQGPNSLISFSLLQPSDLFTVDPATGDIFSKKILHYKHTNRLLSPENSYLITVIATDNGKPPLSSKTIVYITIVDANNNAPVFEQRSYLFPIPEDFPISKRIVQLVANDKDDFGVNAEVEYSFLEGNTTDHFTIETKSGWIIVCKSLESVPAGTVFTTIARATDKGVPPQYDQVSLTLVITGENRHTPIFSASSYQVRVPESEPVNTTILTVSASDGDSADTPNGMIRYQILSNSNKNEFSIHPVTGAVMILKQLDYDSIQEYHLNITVTDLGFESRESTATLNINVSDVNDNPPTFNQSIYKTYLPENSLPNSIVFKLRAIDIDSFKFAQIEYEILGGSGEEYFQIDRETGIITSKIAFDFEEISEYTLDIVAANPDSRSQMVGFTTVLIYITGINEFYPKFIQSVFHFDVSESTEIGTSVGMIQATDRDSGEDGKVYYLFVGSSNDRGFSICPESGIISVAGKLDTETQNRAVLTAMAKNHGGIRGNDTDEAQVIISIQDGNDPPEFLQSIYETSVPEDIVLGTTILTVRAIDKDVGPQNNQFSYLIIGGNVGQVFKIDPQSGDVETTGILDRESHASYQLIIAAIDIGSPPQTGTTTIKIELLDVNDNGPTFESPEIIGYVSENEPPGTSIITLIANDPDLSPNGAPFSYRIIGGKQADLVILDKHSGVLSTTRNIDREVTPELNLLIEVEDSGVPKMKSEHTVTVIVLDENDNPSTQRSVHIMVHSFNGQTPIGKIANIHPNDLDTIGDYTCKILEDSNIDILDIPIACDLHTSKIAPGHSYTLSVSGNDGRHPDVVSTVTIVFSVFTNATVENTVVLLIPQLTASEFLSTRYESLRDTLQRDFDSEDIVLIYTIDEKDDNLYIYLAIETPKGTKSKKEVFKILSKQLNKIKNLMDGKNITIGHLPCDSRPCKNGGSCDDQLIVYNDARIINSQSLILTSSRVVYETICQCQDGFTGAWCNLPQDPCLPSPCLHGGQCRRIGHNFFCSCPSNQAGEYCELEKGDACASNPCKNDGTCKVSPDGSSFFCLCRTGYRGNHCETIIDSCRPNPCLHGGLCIDQKPGYRCSCPDGRYGQHCERSTFGFDELSFMSFPALDANINDITIIFATIKSNALLLYNYGPQSSGRSDFIALELINGKISFSCGGTRSAIVTIQVNSGKKLDDGHWKKVTATRNGRVMSLSVSNCREYGDYCDDCEPGDRNCFVDDMGLTSTLNFNNNSLLLGGLINVDPILERSGQVHSDDFVGCIHSVSVNGRALNLSSPISSRGIRNTCPRSEQSLCQKYGSICGSVEKCFDKWHQIFCECSDKFLAPNCQDAFEPINLSNGGFIEFKISEKHKRMHLLENIYKGTTLWTKNRIIRSAEDEINLSQTVYPSKKISLMFKTIKQNGILLYVATNKHYTAIELRNGQLIYFSMLGPIVNMTGSIGESLSNGKWHNLTILAQSRGIRLLVDKILIGDELDLAGVHDFLDPYLTTLFIGGIRKDLRNSNRFTSNFEGCLSNLTINDEIQPFNGSGSIFKDAVYHGKVYKGCRGLSDVGTAAAAAAATNPLNIGIFLVIIFFLILLVTIFVIFVICKLLQQSKEKIPPSVVNKNTNTIMANSHCSTTDNRMSRHENTYISDTSELRGVGMSMGIGINMGMGIGVGHLGAEMKSRKFKEREITNEQRSQRPDIIEREVAKNLSIREEPLPLLPPTHSSLHSHEHSQELDMPEHYDLENASSIAPSDIDIVYHYKSYRDGMRKYKATPLPINSYNHHKHTVQQPHRHNGPFPPRAILSQSVDQSPGPAPQLLQSTPLARLSPSSELSSQQTRILTLRDISGKPYQSALLATTSSSGGIDKDVLHSNSERSLNSPIMSQLSGSTSSRKVPQSLNDNGNNISRGPMGLTAEEIERLNSRPRISSLVSTLEAVSSSCDVRRPPPPPHGPHGPLHLHQRHKPPTERLERQNSSTTDESESDSFTCSEIEYDNDSMAGNKCLDNLYSKPDNERLRRCNESPESNKPTRINYDGFDSSFKGSLTTLVASDDDLSTQIGSLYRPNSNGSSSKNTALNGDYLLSWGPNFKGLIGVFIDIAKLPDSAGRVSHGLRLATNITKTSEEYV